jgi:SH3-like domain-containing protein
MKNIYQKTGILLLLLGSAIFLNAQQLTYKFLNEELQLLQKQIVPDKRIAILEIEIKDTLQHNVVLSGETDLPDAKIKIIRFLNEKKISFIDSLRVLPDASLGEKIWALSTLSVSNMRAKPDDASELVSQTLMGTPLKVLDFRNKWYRVQTPDSYIGWMYAGELQQFNSKEMEIWKKTRRFLYNRIAGFVCDEPRKKAKVVSDLVLGDLFEVEATVKRFLKIKFPDGRTGYVRSIECMSFEDWSNSEPNAKSTVSIATQMMGFPYLWGGTSTKAVDCSGFVKNVFYAQGVILARDASQQAKYGTTVDFTDRNNLRQGDLIFFGKSAERITHVGIYLGKGDFINSSGRVHISSIDPNDPKYNPARNLVAARSILSSLNTEGIVKVKDHPWYKNQ